jgi:hypothetical protein
MYPRSGPHEKHPLILRRIVLGVFIDPLPSNKRSIVASVGSRGNVFTESLSSNGSIRHNTKPAVTSSDSPRTDTCRTRTTTHVAITALAPHIVWNVLHNWIIYTRRWWWRDDGAPCVKGVRASRKTVEVNILSIAWQSTQPVWDVDRFERFEERNEENRCTLQCTATEERKFVTS